MTKGIYLVAYKRAENIYKIYDFIKEQRNVAIKRLWDRTLFYSIQWRIVSLSRIHNSIKATLYIAVSMLHIQTCNYKQAAPENN